MACLVFNAQNRKYLIPQQHTSAGCQHESHGKSNTFCDHLHSKNLLCSCFFQATLAGCYFLHHHHPLPLHFPDGKHLPYNIKKSQRLICKQPFNQAFHNTTTFYLESIENIHTRKREAEEKLQETEFWEKLQVHFNSPSVTKLREKSMKIYTKLKQGNRIFTH